MRSALRRIILAALPTSARNQLYELRKLERRLRYRLRQGVHGQKVRPSDVAHVLSELGVRQGDVLMVHSSLSRLGELVGGAPALLQALLKAVGPQGTLVMPAYPTIGTMHEHLDAHPLFDAAADPSRMGKLTECLRQYPGAVRSLHPTHSVAAFGPCAEDLTREHHLCLSPFGAESPFQKLIAQDGKILCLGVTIAYISSVHIPEERLRPFPLRVYLDAQKTARVRGHDGVERKVTTLVHDPQVSATRIEKNPPVLAAIRAELLRRGALCETPLGTGIASLVGARALETALEEMAARGLTIYSETTAPKKR